MILKNKKIGPFYLNGVSNFWNMQLYLYYISTVANSVTLQLFLRYVVYNIIFKIQHIQHQIQHPVPVHENPGAHPITATQIHKQISRDLPSRSHSSTKERYKSLSGQVEHPKLSSWIVLPE